MERMKAKRSYDLRRVAAFDSDFSAKADNEQDATSHWERFAFDKHAKLEQSAADLPAAPNPVAKADYNDNGFDTQEWHGERYMSQFGVEAKPAQSADDAHAAAIFGVAPQTARAAAYATAPRPPAAPKPVVVMMPEADGLINYASTELKAVPTDQKMTKWQMKIKAKREAAAAAAAAAT